MIPERPLRGLTAALPVAPLVCRSLAVGCDDGSTADGAADAPGAEADAATGGRPAPPGQYRVTVAASAEPPPHCEGESAIRECCGSLWVVPTTFARCDLPDPLLVEIELTLPESGGLVVPIALGR